MIKAHVVRWKTPLGPRISPYRNSARLVRRAVYGRLDTALKMAGRDPAARVLDFGCWDGHFLPSLLENFGEVWGVDDDSASVLEILPSVSSILQVARNLCEAEADASERLHLVKATGSKLPFADRFFDIVFCLDTLTHVAESDRPHVIDELRRITKPDGRLIFSLPIETGLASVLRQALRTLTRKQSDRATTQYDFRKDVELLQSSFAICRKRWIPVHVVVECRNPQSR